MTYRIIIGSNARLLSRNVGQIVMDCGGVVDDDAPAVDFDCAMTWLFVDPVDCDFIHLVRQSVGCLAVRDGCLRGGRWRSREVSPLRVVREIRWWIVLLQRLVEQLGGIVIIRHWYTGKFNSEHVVVRGRVTRCEVTDVRRRLWLLECDEALHVMPRSSADC